MEPFLKEARMKMRRSGIATIVCLLLATGAQAQGGRAAASAAAPAPASPGSATKPVCVDAEVDGKRALSYDCLSQQLKPKADPQAGASQTDAERLSAAVEPSRHVQPVDRAKPFRLELGPVDDAAAARCAGRGAAEVTQAAERGAQVSMSRRRSGANRRGTAT